MSSNIILTGGPRAGKTTIIKGVCSLLKAIGVNLYGFYTEEMLDSGRSGFKIVTMDGIRVPFAHVNITRGPRIGPYRVDLDSFHAAVIPQFDRIDDLVGSDQRSVFIVDEVGNMECLSKQFVAEAGRLLRSPICSIMTVSSTGKGFMHQVREYAGADLIHVDETNRELLPSIIYESALSMIG